QGKIYSIGLTKGLRSPFQEPDELMAAPSKPAEGPVAVEIALDGIQNRLWEVPIPSGNYGDLKTNGERLFMRDYEVGGGASNLLAVDIANKDVKAERLATGIAGYDLSMDGKKLIVRRGNSFYSVPANAGAPAPLSSEVDLSGWTFAVNPREEWRQMFDEAWRLERDYFYDRNMHGVDWKAMRTKYRPLVDRVRDRRELSNLLAQMVGELSALHMFVYGGDIRRSSDSIGLGMLGGELVRDEALGGFRIERIYMGDPDYPDTLSPLVRPGVDLEVGDTILAVNGTDVLTSPDFYSMLRNQIGKQVLLHVRERDGKERDVIVKPITSGAQGNIQYADWELSRRKIVDERSKGDIGYLHLQAMGSGDIETWARDYYPVFKRSGLIIDVRNNGGGNIDSWIIEKLLRKAWFYWQPRVGDPYWNMQYAFRGHVAVLCNEQTGSDGEAFTEGIKRLGIGKVIGTRTWGGEIWLSSNNFLGDGGIATAAEYGVFGPEGQWLIEGHGVEPDMVVDNLPHATFLGRDAQLDAAIEYLTKTIREKPVSIPTHPTYPDKSFPAKKG
ncbi:protease, partial [bacterium]